MGMGTTTMMIRDTAARRSRIVAIMCVVVGEGGGGVGVG